MASTRRWWSALLERAALLAGTTLFALIVLEVAVRLVAPQDLDFYNGEKILRPSSRPGQLAELIPGASNPSYIGVPVQINAAGLRDHEVRVPKPPGTFRILAIGDSITFGFGVRLEETWEKRLEARLNAAHGPGAPAVEVLNAGLEGTGLDYYYHFVRLQAPKLEPDLVLVSITLNDIMGYGPLAERRPAAAAAAPPAAHFSAPRALNRLLRTHSHLYVFAYQRTKSLLYRVGVFDINTMHAGSFLALEPPSPAQAEAWRDSLGVMSELVGLARARQLPIVFVVFPMEVQLSAETRELYRTQLGVRLSEVTDAPQRRLDAFAADHHVALVDLLERYRQASGAPLYLRNKVISHDWTHPSPAGHELAGDEVFRALGRLRLVPGVQG